MRLTKRDWKEGQEAAERLRQNRNAEVSERGVKLLAEGARLNRHFRTGEPKKL